MKQLLFNLKQFKYNGGSSELAIITQYAEIIDQYVITSSTDIYGNITSASNAFCDISGYSREELMGKNHNIVRHPDEDKAVYKNLWKTIKAGENWSGEILNRAKNGKDYWVIAHISPMYDEQQQLTGYLAIRQDITDRKKLQAAIIKDELTGAFNRRYYNEILPREISRAKRDKKWLAVLMIDADNFKKYNDTYGHPAGDKALIALSKAAQSCLHRSSDYFFRVGGEEFACVYTVTKAEDANLIAERIRQETFDLNIEHNSNIPYGRFTISIGLMILDPNIVYVEEEIYKYADEALYKAKQNGRNRVEAHFQDHDIELF